MSTGVFDLFTLLCSSFSGSTKEIYPFHLKGPNRAELKAPAIELIGKGVVLS
jgi:hypothetical protein